MAIKGKGRTKPKQVTKRPKPTYVQVKPALLMRRWVHVTAAFLVGIGAVLFTFWVVDSVRSANRQEDRKALQARERAAMSEIKGRIDAALQGVGQAQPPTAFSYLPDFTKALDDFEKGNISMGQLAQRAGSARAAARAAEKALVAIDAAKILRDKGFPSLLIVYSLSAEARMVQALQLTQHAADVAVRASEASGAERDALVAAAKGVQDTAAGEFADGYSDYVQAQYMAKVFVPAFGQASGFPPGG